MKTNLISLLFFFALSIGCKKNTTTETLKNNDASKIKATSIDGYKNGSPFINYLGAKMEGC